MPTNSLTDLRCKSAKPKGAPYKMFDGEGLYLWVSTKGAKVWRVAYRRKGKQRQLSLGHYPALSLADARLKRAEIRAILARGEDPAEDRRKAATAQLCTVEQATIKYWESRKDVSAGYALNGRRAIERYFFPQYKARPIGSLTRDEVMGVLRGMDAAGRHVYVRKVRRWLAAILDWAIENAYAAHNPAATITPRKAFSRTKEKHMPALKPHEIPELMQRLALERPLLSVLGCKLLALTWLRTSELRTLRWTDITPGLITIPAERMKRDRDHLVPLSAQAEALLDTLRVMARGSVYVFPSDRRLDRPMSENSILYLLHRIGYKGRMTGHGWRSVASTWANERGYNRDVIERQLAHSPNDKVRAAYNRAEYLPQRRQLLQDWANWLDEAATPAPFPQAHTAPPGW